MPAKARKRGNKWRVMHRGPRGDVLVRGQTGKPVDGGGHRGKGKAERQARAVNSPRRLRQ